MPNEEYLDLIGLARFLDKLRQNDLKNRARNYVIYPAETLSSEYLNSRFDNTNDMSLALPISNGSTDYKLRDGDGNDILIKDLKLGDIISIRQISEYYPERFVGAIYNNHVYFYAYTCLAINHIVQGSMKPVTSGAVYNALLPFNNVSTTTDTTANVIEVPTSAKGLATLKRIGGMSYVYNQLVSDVINSTTDSGITFTKNEDKSITISGTATAEISQKVLISNSINMIANHKYLCLIYTTLPTEITVGITGYALNNTTNFLWSAPSNWAYGGISVHIDNGTAISGSIKITPRIIDLTQWFGSNDNIPSDLLANPSLFRTKYYLGDLDYNTGSIHDSAVTKVESVGVNIWDEVWELGYIGASTGIEESGNQVISKNFIKVNANTTYYVKASGTINRLFLYDINKQFIRNIYFNGKNKTFDSDSAYYIKFVCDVSYGTTYNHDICINVSNSAINGNYYPYTKYELAIPQAIRSITGYGWGVNDNCYNYIDFTLNEFRQYVGVVDLGTLNWAYSDSTHRMYMFDFASTYNATTPIDENTKAKILCSIYETDTSANTSSNLNDKTIDIDFSGTIHVYDSSYTDATAFKTAMSGVMLYYELATPVITDISSLLDEVHIPIEANGTLELANPYNNAVLVIVSFDNGLVDVVLTNHNHDIEQQKEIDFLLRGGNLKTINEQSLVGSGNISISADISHRYSIGLYDSNYTPIFIAFLTDAEQESYDHAPSKDTAISWIKGAWGKDTSNDIWFATDVTNDAGYYEAGTGIVQAYEGLIGVVYDESQGSGSETITAYFADGTTQQIALSDIGDTDQDNYFFRVF